MSDKHIAVFGIYPSSLEAERGAAALMDQGFASSAISVLFPDVHGQQEFAHEKATKAPEGTTAGATAGGLLGGALGVLAGAGALAIPGIGPLLAAGPLMAGLAGLGLGGALGGLVGALVGLGIPEYEAKRYEGHVRNGGTLLSVHCSSADSVRAAKQVLADSGAKDVASSGENRSEKIQWAVI